MSSIIHIGAFNTDLHLPLLDGHGNWNHQHTTFSYIDNPRIKISHYKDLLSSESQWFYVINYQNPETALSYLDAQSFPKGVLDSLIHGRCVLLLNNYSESYFEDEDLKFAYRLLENLISNIGIPSHKIKWITNCLTGEELFASYCERESLTHPGCDHVQFIEFLIPCQEHWNLLNVPKQRFMLMQKLPRPHRMVLAVYMFKNQIDAHMSFHKDHETYDILLWAISKYPNLGLRESDIEDFCATLPRKIDNVSLTENKRVHLNAYANTEMLLAMERTGIHIIGETRFEEPGIFFSEKTMKAIMNKKPFILVGQPGSCKKLKEIGFDTFNPHIDESYDSIPDYQNRMLAITQEISRLNNLSDSEFYGRVSQMNHICEHNFNHIKNFDQKAINLDALAKNLTT